MPPTPATRRPAAARGDGQWALGHREPLNDTERFKRDDDGLKVRDRILNVYARHGFASIDPSDLRGRFRWYGLYTQRRPGIDGGRTAGLEPQQLEDEYFMLRVRIPGGQLDTRQLSVIGELATRYGRDIADITNRQNIQLHWVRIQDVPAIWERLDAVGLSTTEACGDTPRNMLGCPLAGIAEDEIIDGTPALDSLAPFVGDPTFSNLPRKYKTAISGCAQHCTIHEINDIAFVGVHGPDGTPGYDLWVGGGLSTNPMFGQRLGVFIAADRVAEIWVAVTSLFRDHGYRRLRARARLKFLVADWGPATFRKVLESEYLTAPLPDGPAPAAATDLRRDHVGIHRQKDGRFYLGLAPRVGRMSGSLLTQVADLAERHGSGRVRTTIEQKLIILDVPEDQVQALAAALDVIGLPTLPSTFRRQTMACTGIEFCKLAIVNTKDRATDLIAELERRLPGFDEAVTLNINGCPNSCARVQTADIGLRGQIITNSAGERVEGFHVQLGGGLSAEVGFGRKVRGLKVTTDDLADYVERLLNRFLTAKDAGETFAGWVARATDEDLR
ncbi:nitrite/sulfite reductase [Couchioplanes caeruleus]|uniref:nitrite/sulfite reductase n=1 Tax=Couchioplanes caeruleus TaxID=56438 RepID=UPI0020BF92BD|nr:nitrite/sulfite reductase [Couchioplanes caeruleus]UQU67604.1 nitrite/sulfite reductase [Couchioplanes caeruleus]